MKIKRINSKKSKSKSAKLLPHVSFLRTEQFEHVDRRRIVLGATGEFGLPIQIKQIKIVEFTEEAVKGKLVVGNHRHLGESGQWEIIIALGNGKKSIFQFRYRNYKEKVQERFLRGGDIVLIPPGCSLALIALKAGVKVIEISNQSYDKLNYMKDKLF